MNTAMFWRGSKMQTENIIIVVICLVVVFVMGFLTCFVVVKNRYRLRRTISHDEEETPEQRKAWELADRRSEIERAAIKLLEGGIWKDSPDQYSTRERISWLVDLAIEFKIQIDRKV